MNTLRHAISGHTPRGRSLVIALPFGFLLLCFLLPFLIVGKISLSQMGLVAVEDVLRWVGGLPQVTLHFTNYTALAQDTLYVSAYLRSLLYAAATTVLCLAIGYPFAYFMARARTGLQPLLLMAVMLPFWTSFLLRVYAWRGLLTEGGWVADALVASGADQLLLTLKLIAVPGQLMHTPFSLLLGMTYTYLPFMVLPLFSTLSKMDLRLLEAAADLGATPWVAFWRVTVPLSKAGIVAGSMLVFIPCVGEYVIPELLGGPETLLIGRVLYDEFFANNDWPRAAAVAVVMVLLITVPLAMFNKYKAQAQERRA